MSEELKEETTKSTIETLIEKNVKFDKETLKNVKFSLNEFEKFKEKIKPFDLKVYGEELFCINITEENYLETIDELRIAYRLYAMAKEKRLLYIIRQEELVSLINNLQGKLEEYDNFVKEHGEDAAAQEFTNMQLQEFNIYRTQTIPMYLIELETLSSAISDNEKTYKESGERAYELVSGIIHYLTSISDNGSAESEQEE